jgi:hypothetical protein
MLIDNFQLKAQNFLIGVFVGAISGVVSAGWTMVASPLQLLNPYVIFFCAAFTHCIERAVFVEYWKDRIVSQTLWISLEVWVAWLMTAMFLGMAYVLFGTEHFDYAFIVSGAFGAGLISIILSFHVPHLQEVRFYFIIAFAGGMATSIGVYFGSEFICSGRGEYGFICWLSPTMIIWQAIVLGLLLACATREFDDEDSTDDGSTPFHPDGPENLALDS